MKLVWSPDTASKAYLSTVKSCENFKESSVAELLAAMAAGWNAKLIVESWTHGSPVVTSIGLVVAAHHTGGRHVCVVPDERSRSEYIKSMHDAGLKEMELEVLTGEVETVMAGLDGVEFLVVDSKRSDFFRVLRHAKVSEKGAVLVCKNACERSISGFRWHGVLERGTRIVRSVMLPVGQGLDIAHIGSKSGTARFKRGPSRWIRHVDQQSGEEHVFRE